MDSTKSHTPTPNEQAASQGDGIGAAAISGRRGVKKGRKEQITHTLHTHLIDKIDSRARELDISRAAWINLAISAKLKADDAAS